MIDGRLRKIYFLAVKILIPLYKQAKTINKHFSAMFERIKLVYADTYV